jgi:hypothetical protein
MLEVSGIVETAQSRGERNSSVSFSLVEGRSSSVQRSLLLEREPIEFGQKSQIPSVCEPPLPIHGEPKLGKSGRVHVCGNETARIPESGKPSQSPISHNG